MARHIGKWRQAGLGSMLARGGGGGGGGQTNKAATCEARAESGEGSRDDQTDIENLASRFSVIHPSECE
jgi:hypothetical protein